MLLEKEIDVEARDKKGSTELHLAVSNGYVGVVRLLPEKAGERCG
jgi:hypothetical protein